VSQLQSLFEAASQERNSYEIKSVSLEKKNNELEEKVFMLLEKVKYVSITRAKQTTSGASCLLRKKTRAKRELFFIKFK
jgi:hypothetical protein